MLINKILFISVILSLTLPVFAGADKKTNIALIADKASGLDKSALVSLLEVELSQKEGIQLLERAAIDKILEEQQMSASGLLDRNTTIKIGKLLRANAFIIISKENQITNTPPTNTQIQDTNDLIRVRVSETAHGLRLADFFEQSDKTNPQQAIERIIKKIETVINKISQPDEKLIPVGIVDIHRVQLGEQYKMLERTLPVMLSVRLSLEPQIIMLEREDLKVLLDEKLRTEGSDSEFWNSAILIEGYLQPNDGRLEMHLNLKQSDGENKNTFTIQVEPNEPSVAIAKATTEIIQNLQNSPPAAKWNPEQEAEQFYKKGQMLEAHSRYEEAISLFETAHALDPDNVSYTEAVFNRAWKSYKENKIIERNNENIRDTISKSKNTQTIQSLSKRLVEPPFLKFTDLEIAEIASLLVQQIRNGHENGEFSTYDIFNRWLQTTAILNFWPNQENYFFNAASVSSEQIISINRDTRKLWLETCEKSLSKQVLVVNGFQMNNLIRANLTWISSDDPYELMSNLKNTFTKFVMPPEFGGLTKTKYERDNIYDQVFRLPARSINSGTHLKNSVSIFSQLWREYLIELSTIDDPVVRFNSCLDLSYLPNSREKDTKNITQAKQYISEAMNIFSEQLANSTEQFSSYTRTESRIEECFRNLRFGTDEVTHIWINLFEPLIEKKDVRTLAILDPGSLLPYTVIGGFDNGSPGGGVVFFDPNAKQWYFTLEKIAQILKTQEANPQIARALNKIQDRQAQIRKNLPDINKTLTEKIITVKMLLKKDEWLIPIKLFPSFSPDELQVNIQDSKLWFSFVSRPINSILGIREEPVIVNLVSIDLEKGSILSLWQVETPAFPNYLARTIDLVIKNNISYIAVKNAGIVEIPGILTKERKILKNPKLYSTENGLPSLLITSMVQDGNNLIIAYGDRDQESGLGIYEPKTEKWKTIFCSTLNSSVPFNSGTPYQIQYLKLINPGQLYFTLYDMTLGNTKIGNSLGLWNLDINNPKAEPLKIISMASKTSYPVLTETQNKWWIWYADTSIIEFDPFTRTHSFINWNPYAQKNGSMVFKPCSSTIHNKIFWGPGSGNQIIKIKVGEKNEDAEKINNNILDGEPAYKFVSTPYGLVGIGEGTVGIIETENMEK
jgi:hypothetical protein